MFSPQHLFTRVSFIKIFAFSFIALVIGFGFAGFLMPEIIRMVMRMQLRVTPGTMTRKMYEKVPFPLDFRVFMFNITNKDEVMTGAKPILHEIGPYYFEEYKDKFDIVDDKDADTMEYDYRNTYIYHPEKNGPGLTGDEMVTVAHPLILGMFLSINVDRPELLSFVQAAVNGLLHNPKDIFYTGRLWDLLYDGIILDCSSNSFEVTAVCSEFDTGDYREIRRINETAFKFSLFGNTNGTSVGRFKVLRGKKNIRDLGRVLEYNGANELDAWYEDGCNQITGTDGTIFPPFYEKEEGFTIFIPQICRSITTEYFRPSKYAGIKTNRFTLSFDVSKYGSPNCYCRDDDHCPPEGLIDLFPCTGTPISFSAPHFYKTDLAILEQVEGLHPNEEKHEFFMEFYQLAGAPLSALGRIQVNFEIVPIEDVEMMKNMQSMYLPLLWIENGVNLGKKYTNMLKYQLILGLKIERFLKYVFSIGGLVGLLYGALACYMQMDFENDGSRTSSSSSSTKLTNPKVQSIEVISNE